MNQQQIRHSIGWIFRLIVVVAALTFAYVAIVNAKVECNDARDDKSYWAWRYIEPHDNQKCWYRGTRLIPKSKLYWGGSKRGSMVENPPGLGTINYLKLPKPLRDANGNLLHLSGAVITVPTKNEIDEASDILPLEDVIEDRPFGPWEERIGGAFK